MPGVATAQLLTYAEIVDVDLDATNDVNFADVEDYGHRVVVDVNSVAINNYLGWQRNVGSARPSAKLSTANEAAFKAAIEAALSDSFVDIDGVTNGLHFGTANFDTNTDPRKRSSAGVSANDIPMCFVLYKLYGSSAVATLDNIYNLADAHGMLSNETVATAITESFKTNEAGSLDSMFRDLLAADPHRFFDAAGIPMTGIFETNADVSGSGSWNITGNDTIEVKLKLVFQSKVSRRGVAGREHNLSSPENNAGAQENQQTVINPSDYFYVRLQMRALAPPSAPTSLSATAGDGQVNVSFTPGSNGGKVITNYEYSTNGGSTFTAFSPAQTSSPVTITGLTNGTSYNIQLRAVNVLGVGSSSSTVVGTPVSPINPPSAPTGLSATAGSGQVTISFTAGSNGGSAITNYQYSINGGSTFTAFSPAQTTSPVTITGLTNGTAYNIQLKAVNAAGPGSASSTVSATPAVSVPSAPTNLARTHTETKTIITFTPAYDGGSPILYYEMQEAFEYGPGQFFYFGWFNANQFLYVNGNTIEFEGLYYGTYIQLRAVNSIGAGASSSLFYISPPVLPINLTNLTGIPGDGQVTINFSQPTGTVTNYEYSINNGATFTAFSPAQTTNSVSITGLTNGTTYNIQLKAINTEGVVGNASSTLTITPSNSDNISVARNLMFWYNSTGVGATQWTNKVVNGTNLTIASPAPSVSGNAIIMTSSTGAITGTMQFGTRWTYIIAAKRTALSGGQAVNKSYYARNAENTYPVFLDDYAVGGQMGTLEIFAGNGFPSPPATNNRYTVTNNLGENKFVTSFTVGASSMNGYFNGQKVLTNIPYSNPNVSASYTGLFSSPIGGERFTGEVYEVLIYNGELNDTEMNTLHTYLANKYSITF